MPVFNRMRLGSSLLLFLANELDTGINIVSNSQVGERGSADYTHRSNGQRQSTISTSLLNLSPNGRPMGPIPASAFYRQMPCRIP